MQCPRCRHDNPHESNFCLGCGARLGLACPSCGQGLPAGSRFCNKCGTPVEPAAVSPRGAAPAPRVPEHLAERILASRSALEGERKQVTVLFADLKGSMELLAERDPEEARKLLDPVLEHMMEAVHRYEGTVNQVMGDGIMALFGAPLAHEDHAVRACYAALRMQEEVRRYGEDARRRHGVVVHARVGLNSGEVVVRSIASNLRMDYSAIGQTTHLAARMEQMAMPGSIVVTAHTLALAEGWIQVEPLGLLPVKGLAEPVEAYELTGVGTARTRLQVSAARGLTRFVGRDVELEQLRAGMEQAHRGAGQVVAVVGEPGVGKSRLFHEFIHSHRTRGWLTLETSSMSHGRATAYLPVLDLLRGYFRIEPRDDTRAIREKVAGKVLTLDRSLEDLIQPILALLDGLPEDSPFAALDPQQRRQQTLQALKTLMLRESRAQPVCLVVEDLHWIDTETQSFLDGLVESLPTSRLLLLVNYRPEYRHDWSGRTYYRQLRIDPLGPEGVETMLASLLGEDPGLDQLRRLLIQRTEGNPLFLEECVRTLVETQVLAGAPGAYRLTRGLSDLQVPATVQAVLAARIDRLAPEDKRLLQTAAVVGKDVPYPLLQAVADVEEQAIRRSLGRLQASEFLYEAALFPELEYTFKHALTHEVAYGSVLGERRRTLHGRIAEAIERLRADRLTEQIEQLAHHAFRAQSWARAASYSRQAGRRAHGRWALREAVACYEQALEALGHLAVDPDQIEQAVDTRLALCFTLTPRAEFAVIRRHLRDAEAGARSLGDQVRLARVLAYLSECSRQAGDHAEAEEIGERARMMAVTVEDVQGEQLANFHLGMNYRDQGDFPRAVARFRRNRDLWLSASQPSVTSAEGALSRGVGSSIGWLAWCLARLGSFSEAATIARQELKDAEEAGSPVQLATACNALGGVHLLQGDASAALRPLERGLELCQTLELSLLRPILAASAGLASTRAGRIEEGMARLEEGVARGEEIGLWSNQTLRMAWLGEGHLLAGHHREAAAVSERALALARRLGERGNEADLLWLEGEIAWRDAPPDLARAEAAFGQALALASALEMRPLVARCHLGLGQVRRRTGQPDRAHEHLATAAGICRQLDMHPWLALAEEEAKGLA